MNRREKSTEWALLFPLKAGLFAVKSSISLKTINQDKERVKREQQNISIDDIQLRHKMRRGSSLSDLDKLHYKGITLPDVIRSMEKSSESLPQSPALSRTNLQLSNSHVRGSIGDLMNMKKYGGSTWSIKSETLITKFVPLSTVTSRQISAIGQLNSGDDIHVNDNNTDDNEYGVGELLTCAQRTQRLIKLIQKRQRCLAMLSPVKSGIVS